MRTKFECLLLLTLVGCSSVGTYSLKEYSPAGDSGPKVAFIDIKQRAILSAKRAPSPPSATPAASGSSAPPAGDLTGKSGSQASSSGTSMADAAQGQLVLCAEPSPDALSSFASELSADAKYKDLLAASLASSQQENASFVGLRTQSIQLLRDAMFRLCEGYMGGALSPADYAWLTRRYQKNMVALLTIEQLTRVAQVPPLGQTSAGTATAARTAAAIEGEMKAVDDDIARLDSDHAKLGDEKAGYDKLDASDTKQGKLDDVNKRISANEAAKKSAQDVKQALTDGLSHAEGVLAQGSTTVQIIGDTQDPRNAAVTEAVVNAIAEITKLVASQDDLETMCFQVLDSTRRASAELQEQCKQLISKRVEMDEAVATALKKAADNVKTVDEAKKLINVATGHDNVSFTVNQQPGEGKPAGEDSTKARHPRAHR